MFFTLVAPALITIYFAFILFTYFIKVFNKFILQIDSYLNKTKCKIIQNVTKLFVG